MKTIKTVLLAILTVFFLNSGPLFAQGLPSVSFISDLKQGDSSPAVLALQKILNSDNETKIASMGVGSPGLETDYFGALTKAAVVRFQNKYRNEILVPAGLQNGTGYVGAKTIAKLNELQKSRNAYSPTQKPAVSPVAPITNSASQGQMVNPAAKSPMVFSVSPAKVRSGDLVTIKGANFTPVNNMVILGDGPVKERFDNLASLDGATLSFVYKTTPVSVMTKEEILALPQASLSQIETPIQKSGLTLDDALEQYKGINNESELKAALEKNGHAFDEIYRDFYVMVFNSNGNAISKEPLLAALPHLPFNQTARSGGRPASGLAGFFGTIFSTITASANALGLSGGGYTSGIVMPCTCNGGFLTFQFSYTGSGTGLYYFPPGFMPNAGSGLVASPWLGGFIPMGSVCSIYAGIICVPIPANAPSIPIGFAF